MSHRETRTIVAKDTRKEEKIKGERSDCRMKKERCERERKRVSSKSMHGSHFATVLTLEALARLPKRYALEGEATLWHLRRRGKGDDE